MAVKTVTGKLTDLSGNAIPYPRVRATLSAPAVIAATQEVAPTTLKVIGAADGTWTMLAQANADLIPANTSYNWEVGEAWSGSVIVPQTAGPFKIEDVMAPPPPLGAAWDATLVHLAGTETLTGVKRFGIAPVFGNYAQSALAAAIPSTMGTVVMLPPPLGSGQDDSPAVQPIIDALSAAGGGVIFAWGTYTGNIVLKAGVYIVGMVMNRALALGLRFNQFGAGPVIDTPAGSTASCGVIGATFHGLGAGTAGNAVRFQSVSAGVLAACGSDNFADEGFAVRSGSLACKIEDLFAQNCVLNRSRAAVIGAIDIDGTDHWLGRLEGTASVGSSKTSANLYCCGVVIRGSQHKVDRIIGEVSDQGIVVLASNSKFGLSSAEFNLGHGWNVLGASNDFAICQGLSNSQDTTNTYDNWRADSASAKNNYDSCRSENTLANVTKYGFEDLVQSYANRNSYTNPRSSGSGTQEYISQTNAGSSFLFGSSTMVNLTANSATPDVTGYERFQTNNSAPTTITDFLGGVQGQRLLIRCGDSNTTVQHNGATISMLNAGDRVLRVGVLYEFVKTGVLWREVAAYPLGTSTDNGDLAKSLQARKDLETQVWATALTANRAVTLSGTGVFSGAKFHIVRKASATGASTLDVGAGPLKSLAAGQWCDVEHDGSAWLLTAFGSL